MTTPKDIDGNELKVGDLVVAVGAFKVEDPERIGTIAMIDTFSTVQRKDVTDGLVKDFFVFTSPALGAGERGMCMHWRKLLDQKAPTKIEFVTTKEGVR